MTEEDKLFKLIKKANEEQTKLLKEEIKNCVTKVDEKVENALRNTQELKKNYLTVERRLRRNNVVIFGLEVTQENLIGNVLSKLNNLLQIKLQESDVYHIYTLGKNTKPPVVLELMSFLKKQVIFSKVSNLKGSGIAITNDLCYEDRENRKILRYHQNKAREQSLDAKIKGNTLIIGSSTYTVEDLKKLENEAYIDSTDTEVNASEDEESEKEEEVVNTNFATIRDYCRKE